MSDEIKAGRELDALVAEKVMGLTVVRGGSGAPYVMPFEFEPLPYSTDIAAAMSVVDHVWKQGIENPFRGLFEEPVDMRQLPLEICTRALEAVTPAVGDPFQSFRCPKP